MIAKLIEFLAEKFAGRIATKLVTVLATFLLTHGLLKQTAAAEWIETTAGIVAALLSLALSAWQHGEHKQAVATALQTPVPGGLDEKVFGPGPLVGMSNTQIGQTNQPKDPP